GIDLDKFGKQLFGLYKRFHLKTEGKGLGLYMSKMQLESLGGSIDVESTPGIGTTFNVKI
ncbi:MAG: histidine kinase, partial [Bacteroidia bacterium]|nr:histidine kinase [Bacteroidia bacterium]